MTRPLYRQMTDSVIARHPLLSRRWHYEPGVVLTALRQAWQRTGDTRCLAYIAENIDAFVAADGSIHTYRLDEFNLDQINEGKLLFLRHQQTGKDRYRQAADLLREQLRRQPRTAEGGYWHKQIYPHQMWLDGLYMAEPFHAEYASVFDEPDGFDEVVRQFALLYDKARDPATGLLYHGWDSSRQQAWADPATGCSPHFWGRAIGWVAMALPDVLDHFPADHAGRERLIAIFQAVMAAVIAVQDPASGLWYQVLDQGDRPGNYLEASASCMFVYGLAKGVRLGYLDPANAAAAGRGYQGIVERFVRADDEGQLHLEGICAVGGLGGNPYRDGSFDYYIGEKVIADDYKGVGAFIMASIELEAAG